MDKVSDNLSDISPEREKQLGVLNGSSTKQYGSAAHIRQPRMPSFSNANDF